ncbi:MAG: RHS repeat-associated core domain-containing protein [Simkaniaceae bacterium]
MGKVFYLLDTEKLPSGHQLRYIHDKKTTHLKRIESTNPSGNKIYASVDIDYFASEKRKPFEIKFKTSDGKQLHYKTTRHEDREYINEIQSNCRPSEKFNLTPGRKGIGARLASINLAGKELFSVQYYLPSNRDQERKWAYKPEKKEFHIDKVKKILAPVGPNGEKIAIANFSYYPNGTDVRDAEGLLIRYHHDSERLTLIEYFNEKDQLRSSQKFYWKGTELRCKAMFNESHQPLFAKTFIYDAGNVVEETLWGYLTGNETTPLQIDTAGRCSGGESYRKTYSYYKGQFNLLKTEHEEDGPTYKYFYKSETDLCTAKLTKDKKGGIQIREFSFYNDDNLIIHEIVDNGSSLEPNDIRDVTQRLEKRYERNDVSGLPESLSESYLDLNTQTLKLLRIIKYTYLNQRVHTEEVFDALGVSRYTITTDYDDFSSVKRKTTPLGRENAYRYKHDGSLEESKEVGSPKKVFAYDQANRLKSCEEPDTGKIAITSYDLKSRILTQTDFRGNQTIHTYDFFGNRKTTELPKCKDEKRQTCSPILNFDYDIHGNLTLVEMPLKEKTLNTYNLFRKPILITQADETQIRHFYNRNGTLKKTLYSDGTEVHYGYDLFKRQTSKTIYSSQRKALISEEWNYGSFQLLSYTDTRGLKTEFTYDGAGRKIAEEAQDRKITFAYDPLGFLEKMDNGIIALVQKYNVEGFIDEQWEEEPTGRIENWMKFSYDQENQKEKAFRKTSQGESVDLFNYTDGELSSHTDPNGYITTFIWNEFFQNELGQNVLQKTTTDPIGHTTVETYDAGKRIVSREKKNAQGQTVFKERFLYDASGNKAELISYVYADGMKIKEIPITWKYDVMGRVKAEIESGQKTTFYDYDSMGRLEWKILPNGVCLHYSYDGADRLQELTSSDGKIHYQYFYETGPDPVQISDLIQETALTRRYNLFGQVISETNSRGLSSRWDYDSIGRCILFTLPDGSSVAYLAKGIHIGAVQRKDPRGNLLYEHSYCKFDCNGRIAEEDCIFDLGKIQTTHDLLERPKSQTCSYLELSISYGPCGLVTRTHNSLFGEKFYKHDALNQLKEEGDQVYDFDSLGNPTEFEINNLNQIYATPECTLTYDDNGNPKEKMISNETIEYKFDPLGRLIKITTAQKRKVLYFYDPLSRLFAKETYTYTANAWKKEGKVFYLYDRDREIGTQGERGHLLELKILGLGIRGDIGAAVALEIGGNVYAPLHDFNGNIVAIVSPDGNIAEKYEIDAFGKEKSPAPFNPWRFSSKRSEEGLFFFGLRFYDPTLGRWLNPDPAGFVDGANLYVFVQNNPLNRLDLFGLISEDPFKQVQINIPVPVIPRLPGFNAFLAKGVINGIEVDFVLCCGHWHQLQFTPEELKTNNVDIMNHLHELTPTDGKYFNLVTVGNGVYTSLEECFNMSSQVGQKVGDTLLMALYNPTGLGPYGLGCGIDLDRVRKEREKIETPIVCLARQFMATTGEKLYNINPQSLWLCIPHSENGVITKRAIEGMTRVQQEILQKILYVFAVGPAEPLAQKQGASVINVYSNQDYITGFGLLGYAKRFMNNPDYDVRIISCISSRNDKNLWIADHGFLRPTYFKAWGDHINELKENFIFYEGSKNANSR